ncbi:MAG: ornithine cyclodeaminase family protein, partial [Bacillota bacterium]|nr:ornithine cyclodeaminase family protein [Bacillota bacterium]
MKIAVIRQNDMRRIFSMEEAIKADRDALELYSKGKSQSPLRVTLSVPEHNGLSLYMPGYVPDLNALGVKIVSTYPGNYEKGIP